MVIIDKEHLLYTLYIYDSICFCDSLTIFRKLKIYPGLFILFEVEEYQMENETEACDVDLSKVLHLGRGVGAEDHEAQRVIQVVWRRKMLMCHYQRIIVYIQLLFKARL